MDQSQKPILRSYKELPRNIKPDLIPVFESNTKGIELLPLNEFVKHEEGFSVFPSMVRANIEALDSSRSTISNFGLSWGEGLYTKMDKNGYNYLVGQLQEFFEINLHLKRIQPSIANLLGLATKIMWTGTSGHNNDAHIGQVEYAMSISNPVPTICKVFNSTFVHVFSILCELFQREDLLSKLKFVYIPAEFADDLGPSSVYKKDYDDIEHGYLVIIAYTVNEFKSTPIDPYHSGRSESDISKLFTKLDRYHDRGLDALNGFYRAISSDAEYIDRFSNYNYVKELLNKVIISLGVKDNMYSKELLDYIFKKIENGVEEMIKRRDEVNEDLSHGHAQIRGEFNVQQKK